MNLKHGSVAFILSWWFLLGFTSQVFGAAPEPVARQLFKQKEALVYQIRVIDITSGDKYSIGSGFRVRDTGLLATNFHVVSSFVHEPDKYRLEYVAADESKGPLSLLAIDVVHDLAIVQAAGLAPGHLALAEAELAKGDRIYSMGNPRDLGMTIVEGTYNGLVENSRYQKILFSGSLNPGMSGGPALNSKGEVIGVNVSKGGEQLSFLVPVGHLYELLDNPLQGDPEAGFEAAIRQSLVADQDRFYAAILESPLQTKLMGEITIPKKLHPSLKCWGHTVDEEDLHYGAVHQHCKSEDEIFISDRLYLGKFSFDAELIHSEGLNRFQFYNALEERFNHHQLESTYDEEEVTGFNCRDDLVSLRSGVWKVSTCFREYTKYPGLYDASMVMVTTDYPQKAAIVKIASTGISANNARGLFTKVMGAIAWKH